MKISKLGLSIAESTTLKLNETFNTLKSQGIPVIHLGGGEPFGKASRLSIELAEKLLKTGVVRYSPSAGTKELRQAVCDYTEKFYGFKPDINNVIISNGAKQAIFISLLSIINPDDEVLFVNPYWVSYPEMVKLAYGKPVHFIPSSKNFIPTIEEFKKNITPKTKAILINSPNNPTGVMYPESLITELVKLTAEKNIYLIMDDIYHRLVFDNKQHPSVLKKSTFAEDSHLIIVNGISKSFAMTGFRIGWAIASPKLIKVMTNIQSHQTGGPSPLLQKAALGAITGTQNEVKQLKEMLEENRNLMIELLSQLKNVNIIKPDGTFYLFADFSYYEKDSLKLSASLLEKAKVLTMPGIAFGLDGHLRLSFCNNREVITEGVKRIISILK